MWRNATSEDNSPTACQDIQCRLGTKDSLLYPVASHWFISGSSPFLHPISLTSISIHFYQPYLGLRSDFFPLGVPQIKFCMQTSYAWHMPQVTHISFCFLWNNIWKKAQNKKVIIISLLKHPLISSIMSPNIFLRTLFSNNLNPLRSSLMFIHAKG